MSITVNKWYAYGVCFVILILWSLVKAEVSSLWQNPNIGLTLDATADIYKISGSWKSPGVNIRGAELIISANIDPYASLLSNILISQHGAELHEAFANFPALPLNLKLKTGLMLANFGRWNRFHTHNMPFTSEPRVYKEYVKGMLSLRGIELSWLVPISHYLEITFSAYDLIEGHSHDLDPPDNSNDLTPDEVAYMIGAIPHGSHYDYKDMHIYDENDLYTIAGLPSPNDPQIYRGTRNPIEFAYGSRVTSSFDFGSSVTADIGISLLGQKNWKQSKRTDFGFPEFYNKFLCGTEIVFFWHPLSANKYRNFQISIEILSTRESFENLYPNPKFVTGWRTGGILHLNYQHTQQWHFGGFISLFQSNSLNKELKMHSGAYVTFALTHYQYIRFEYSRYEYPHSLNGVNKVMLQYNATIGYHTHGRQR